MFKTFLPPQLMKDIAQASTEYKRTDTKTPAALAYSSDDIYRFILVNLLMGLNIKPNLREYWYGMDPVKSVIDFMSYSEFTRLATHIHCVNTAIFTDAEKAAKSNLNSFWQLGTFPADLSDLLNSPSSDLLVEI